MFAFHTYWYKSFQLWVHWRRPPFLFFAFPCMFALASSGGNYDGIKFSQPRYQEAGREHFETYRLIGNSALARLKLVTFRPCIGIQHRAHTVISNGSGSCHDYNKNPHPRQLCYISLRNLHYEPGFCYYLRQAPASSLNFAMFRRSFCIKKSRVLGFL